MTVWTKPETVAAMFARASRLFREGVVEPVEPIAAASSAAAPTAAPAAPETCDATNEKGRDDGR